MERLFLILLLSVGVGNLVADYCSDFCFDDACRKKCEQCEKEACSVWNPRTEKNAYDSCMGQCMHD